MATAGSTRATAGARTPAQTFALVFGAVYLLVGIIGFAFTGIDDFASTSGDKLIIFQINPLHNIVHIAIGAVWLGAAKTHAAAKGANLIVGAVLLLVAVIGFINVTAIVDLLNIGGSGDPDNFLHLVTGAAGVLFGTSAAGGTTTRTAA